MKKILFITLIAVFNTSQAFITVGTDAACDRPASAFQSSINDFNQDEIRVTNQQNYDAISMVNKNVMIIGGFNNCNDASNNIVSNIKTTISGNNSVSAITINTSSGAGNAHKDIIIENINVINGSSNFGAGIQINGNVSVVISNAEIQNNSSSNKGGGLYINGANGSDVILTAINVHDNSATNDGGGIYMSETARVTINDSLINSNSSKSGAGISVKGPESIFNINDSIISQNIAINYGGGIDCVSANKIYFKGNSSIDNNESQFGGGVALATGCQFSSSVGDNLSLLLVEYGIHQNFASLFGGGVFLTNGARLDLIGDAIHYANVTSNQVSTVNGKGGGIYAANENTYVRSINARINANVAHRGAAIYMNSSAKFHMRRSSGECFGDQICSEIGNNNSSSSGTITTASCGSVDIYQTKIYNNIGNYAVVANFNGNTIDSCGSTLEGNLIYDNHKADNSLTSMFYIDRNYHLDFAYNTMTDNIASSIFNVLSDSGSNQSLNINSSLIWNAPAAIIIENAPGLNNFSGKCFVVHDDSAIPAGFGSHIREGNPIFADAANDDYSTTEFSPYSDYCDTSLYQPRFHDIVGVVRGHAWLPPILGPYDMGAFEFDDVHFNNVIFQDGFE